MKAESEPDSTNDARESVAAVRFTFAKPPSEASDSMLLAPLPLYYGNTARDDWALGGRQPAKSAQIRPRSPRPLSVSLPPSSLAVTIPKLCFEPPLPAQSL